MNISPVGAVPRFEDRIHEETMASFDAIGRDSNGAMSPDGGDSPSEANTGSSFADRFPQPDFALGLSQKYTMFLDC
jgi:hypothetical protein